mmetsp:Transcript_36912/g.119422  ORF Transcript_36912/g.119422 Transcript_36912/m.119422 type:complete len:263 (+) Transcript_36912:1079-1867(+)
MAGKLREDRNLDGELVEPLLNRGARPLHLRPLRPLRRRDRNASGVGEAGRKHEATRRAKGEGGGEDDGGVAPRDQAWRNPDKEGCRLEQDEQEPEDEHKRQPAHHARMQPLRDEQEAQVHALRASHDVDHRYPVDVTLAAQVWLPRRRRNGELRLFAAAQEAERVEDLIGRERHRVAVASLRRRLTCARDRRARQKVLLASFGIVEQARVAAAVVTRGKRVPRGVGGGPAPRDGHRGGRLLGLPLGRLEQHSCPIKVCVRKV